ncbi:MAG TPA: two-component regulator propeller domain-containing protein [Bryobacteraceae bacterium]|nr:two-component regulator propeller domain-containing protein [Bryobacteraceae bacterium]
MERRANSTQVKACATIILVACCPCAYALNLALDINQYAHNAWTVREGFFKGAVGSIAQTQDGYLWLGTEFGLLRFDGVRVVPWQPPGDEHLPTSVITALLAPRDGSLWIGTLKGLASWKDGKLTHYPELAGQGVVTLLEDREGVIWAGGQATSTGRLCTIQGGRAQCYGEDGGLGRYVFSLYEDKAGNLWAGAATGIWRWKPGPPKFYPMRDPPNDLIEGDNGTLLVATSVGITQLDDGKAKVYPLRDVGRQFRATRLFRDRNGALWIGTGKGLLHVHQGRTDQFARPDGLSGPYVSKFFEDREGNIWVATVDGLDRFRDLAAPTISASQGLSNNFIMSVLAVRDGSLWLGTPDGLNLWKDGQITIYRKQNSGLPDDGVQSLFQDDHGRIWVSTFRGVAYFENGRFIPVSSVPGGGVSSIAGDAVENLWISHHDQGLIHLFGGTKVERTPWAGLGRKDWALALLSDPLQGGLWLGFEEGGVAYFKDGQIRASYAGRDGLAEGRVTGLQMDRDGTLWAATEGGLSRVKDGRVATLTSKNGLPCDTVHWVIEDNDHSFWLYTACGLVRIARTELDAWAADSKQMIHPTVFGSSDGVRSRSQTVACSPQVAKSTDGKLWFLPFDGVSVIDPRHIPYNNLPPPVHIEEIIADRKTHDASSNLHLSPLVHDLEIDYTALSLVAAEKVFFRIKLEGRDPDWKDMGTERKAFYSDLPPRHYRFRVKACSNSGVWNEAGASFDFSIDPTYYQTRWFQASCVAAFLAMVWGVYRFRLHQIAERFNAHLEGRVDERTRVARELHDTLLQSFQASLLVMQSARNLLTRRPEKAGETLDSAIDMASDAITEGRDAIQDLRLQPAVQSDLSQLLTTTGQELARSQDATGNPVIFEVTIEGERRDLDPILEDEVYRIGREVLRNAFRHAHASRIEVEIRYDGRLLRVRIRDDGKGIDPQVLEAGAREGHWGLPGMRERAKKIGARMVIWSEAGAGTEVDLTVPARIAYAKPRIRRRFGLFRKKGEAS